MNVNGLLRFVPVWKDVGVVGILSKTADKLKMNPIFNQVQVSHSSIDFDFLFSFSVYW